jgi:Asp-tRNA(Asn)/Glu-tRNA(Gln) amidotransferase A subunit family amidase
MSPLDPLAPDQRAVVALVLQQGRSYDEIAAMLGIPVDAVRARAHGGLADLVPENGLPREITGPLADYLLGQQPERDAEATRGLLAESAPAREWAAGVAAALADVDLVLTPTLPCVAPRIGAGGTGDLDVREALIRFTYPFSLLGWPALALPCGSGEDGLPVSLQIAAPAGKDALVLAAGKLARG